MDDVKDEMMKAHVAIFEAPTAEGPITVVGDTKKPAIVTAVANSTRERAC
jgi:hypothetical protein